jgi:SAM-dependent methyltransferase
MIKPMTTKAFYDHLTPYYHLIYDDWDASIARQALALDKIIRAQGTPVRTVLDVACGIGTQALGLARLGYQVQAADLSPASVKRARREARQRALKIRFSVADMQDLEPWHGQGLDLVMACDNAVPHLLTDRQILKAFKQAGACLRPGGLALISVRDYQKEKEAGTLFKSYGSKLVDGTRTTLFQTRRFEGQRYELSFYVVQEREGQAPKTLVSQSRYYAIGIPRLCQLMRQAGFKKVKRVDGAFFQPVIVGIRDAK